VGEVSGEYNRKRISRKVAEEAKTLRNMFDLLCDLLLIFLRLCVKSAAQLHFNLNNNNLQIMTFQERV
jgi:hypothetical protein